MRCQLALALAVACAACKATGTFACDTDDQCQGGTCEPTHYCGFSDTSCPSGFRYDPYAGGGLAGVCVVDGTTDGGVTADAVDGMVSSLGVLHLGSADSASGTAPLTLGGTVTIDTTGLTISGITLAPGDSFDARPQLGGGPELAVLHLGSLVVSAGASVRITGSRPLVIVADGPVTVDGKLDAGGHGATSGAGAATTGAGTAGSHGSNDSDTGGGGGGFGTNGADGGAITGCTVALGVAGRMYGDGPITQLVGGSAGGSSSGTSCPVDAPGGGGGALQITSGTMISIGATGAVLAGGGGGSGGTDCGASDVNSGPGGGSGGAIVLQAPAIANAGVVAANGGAGGGSSSTGNGNAMPGQDAQASTVAAVGGTGPNAQGGSGGTGGAAPTTGGGSACGTNAAGGGGSVGRIAASTSYTGGGTTSPAANTTLPL
jgi:hypothetical protein